MKRLCMAWSVASLIAMASTVAQASVLTFDTGQDNNERLDSSFGSNLSANIAGANISNGATPNIGLTWAPRDNFVDGLDPSVWELHGASTFSHVGDGDILQLDLRQGLSVNPTLTFDVDPGFSLQLNSLVIGHATDMTEPASAWTITISEVGGGQVFTHTTAPLDGQNQDTEDVFFNFLGTSGTDYILEFDSGVLDNGDDVIHFRGGIDNLSFQQVAVPEPSTLMLSALGIPFLLRRRRS